LSAARRNQQRLADLMMDGALFDLPCIAHKQASQHIDIDDCSNFKLKYEFK
jgi:hypothetical protein